MIDLSRDDCTLVNSSSLAEVLVLEPEHEPVLQNSIVRGTLQLSRAGFVPPPADRDRDTPPDQVRFGRFRTHFALDLPVPPKLYGSVVPVHHGLGRRFQTASTNEFSHVRYTPVNCSANDFTLHNYTLRQACFATPRQIEICICVSMYNEDECSLGNTLHAIYQNIRSLQEPLRMKPWGPDSWKKIVVCIVSDGKAKIDEKSRAMLAALGVYQEFGNNFDQIDGRETIMHLFEYTTHAAITVEQNTVRVCPGAPESVPCQTILCLKRKNEKKIDSHRWFINAICTVIKPNVSIFLDAGAIPSADAIYRLWKPLNDDLTVASTVGSCKPAPGNRLNLFIGFQRFEYELNNTLERPIESILGRRFAMNRGGFVAYRHSITPENHSRTSVFADYLNQTSWLKDKKRIIRVNAELSEDRAISLTLLQPGLKTWRTVCVNAAEVAVDIPDDIAQLAFQRRRWINGDLFSTLNDFREMWPSLLFGWLSLREMGIILGLLYQAVSLILQYFALGNLFAIFVIVTATMGDDAFWGTPGRNTSVALAFIYLFLLFSTIVHALGNRPNSYIRAYTWLSMSWSLLFGCFTVLFLYLVIRGSIHIVRLVDHANSAASALLRGQLFLLVVWPCVLTLVIWLLAPLTLRRKPHNPLSFFWYLFFLPAYINVVTVYAFCNVNDVTWGTMGESQRRKPPPTTRTFHLEQDANGDIILHNLQGYLDDLDAYFDEQNAVYTTTTVEGKRSQLAGEIEDYIKEFRTLWLLLWLGLNAVLVMIVVNIPSISRFTPTADGGKGLLYMGAVLWAHAGVLVFQYFFTLLYAASLLIAAARGYWTRGPVNEEEVPAGEA